MESWIGNKPTTAQKSLKIKYDRMLNSTHQAILQQNETIFKAIEGELDKRGRKEIDGVIALTEKHIMFISRSENHSYDYSTIRDIQVVPDGKDKHEWKLSFFSGRKKIIVDDIAKNEDSDEFFYILEEKVRNPNQFILSTVTHNFNYFLHADRLADLRAQGVLITPFLLKRDDQGAAPNGLRLLGEKHPQASIITQGQYKKEKAEGHFIVVDNTVYVYGYDNKERKAFLLHSWPYAVFNGASIDYFALKTLVTVAGGVLTLSSKGKDFATLLGTKGQFFTVQKRKWHQKILGFRSGKLWKKSVAFLAYLLFIFASISMVFGEEAEISDKTVSSSTQEQVKGEVGKSEQKAKEESELKKQEEEVARLAEEKKAKEEAERLASEQKAKEEAERLASEQKVKEEAARLAAEAQAKTEAAEQARIEAAAAAEAEQASSTNLLYDPFGSDKNCSDFPSGADAQEFYIAAGGPASDPHDLDRDNDGNACDWN